MEKKGFTDLNEVLLRPVSSHLHSKANKGTKCPLPPNTRIRTFMYSPHNEKPRIVWEGYRPHVCAARLCEGAGRRTAGCAGGTWRAGWLRLVRLEGTQRRVAMPRRDRSSGREGLSTHRATNKGRGGKGLGLPLHRPSRTLPGLDGPWSHPLPPPLLS